MMKMKKIESQFFLLMLTTLCVSLVGCTVSDFDLSKLDTTIGIGGDTLALPGGNTTKAIKLDDILNIAGSDCIVLDADSNYVFSKSDNNIAAAHPLIDKISAPTKSINYSTIDLLGTSSAKVRRAVANEHSFSGKAFTMNFTYGGITDEIKSIDKANVDGYMKVALQFSEQVSSSAVTFKTLSVSFPAFMQISSVSSSQGTKQVDGTNTVTFENVTTSSDFEFTVNIGAFDFTKSKGTAGNTLTFSNHTVTMDGQVSVAGVFTVGNPSATSGFTIDSKVTTNDFIINGGIGKFAPSITFNNIGSVDMSNVPDFLSESDVVLDIYNPQIILTVASDMPLQGLIEGDLIAVNNAGKTIATVHVPQFTVLPSATTTVCICRNRADVTGNYNQIVEVSNLSDIVKTIPKNITFSVTAKGDGSVTSTLELGHQYTITPQYAMYAPLAFGEKAQIVYRDTLDGMNDDVKDMKLADGGKIVFSATAENKVPAYLTLTANAIDKNHNIIGDDKISIVVDKTIAASDGTTPVQTAFTVTVKQTDSSAFKIMDGIIIKAAGAASDGKSPISGVKLNASKQTLILKDIKAKVYGGVIADLN